MSRVFVTGDTHYKEEYEKIERLCNRFHTSKDDFVVILGDNGVNYYGDKRDKRMKKYLESLPISFVMIRGNHDKRPDPHTYRETEIDEDACKGTFFIEDEYPHLLFCKEFGFYSFAGKRCFVIAGAYSVDKWYRLEMYDRGYKGFRWFYDEQLSPQEIADATAELSRSEDNPPEIILSHTCPLKYKPYDKLIPGIDQSTVDEKMERWLDEIEDGFEYKKWYCGHWHIERSIDKMRFMYFDIIELE